MSGELKIEQVPGVDPGEMPSRGRRWQVIGVLIVVAAAIVAMRIYRVDQLVHPEKIRALVTPFGAWGPLVYSVFKIVTMLLVIPLMPVSVAAGLLFGFTWGAVINIVTNMIGSSIAFAIARQLGGDAIRSRLTGRWASFDRAMGENGFSFLLFMRLTPLFPWNGVSYAVAVTQIGWRDYLLASAVGMLPTTLVYSYVGAAAGEASIGKFAVALTLLALITLIPAWRSRRKAKLNPDQPEGLSGNN